MPRPPIDVEIKDYDQAKAEHALYHPDWRMCAAYCSPRSYNAWMSEGRPFQPSSRADTARFAYDSTGILAVKKFVAVSHRLATPDGMRYQSIAADDNNLMKVHAVRVFFYELTELIFKMRYNPYAGFVQAQGETYRNIGVYGNGPKSLTWAKGYKGFNYRAWPMRDMFASVDDEGRLTIMRRRMFLNARQFRTKFGEGVHVPKKIRAELDKPGGPAEGTYFEIVHCVRPADDYMPDALDRRRHPYIGYHYSVEDKEYIDEPEGFISQIYNMPRAETEAGSAYAYSPAMEALPALGGVNQMKKTGIKVGHKAADPPLLMNDDGALGGRIDQRPGATVPGGIDRQGRQMVVPLQTGANWRIAEKLIEDERKDIREPFFAPLFDILLETNEMTATQVVERLAKETALVAPLMGRYQTEDRGPETDREIALLDEHGLLPEVPPELIEAKGQYKITYTSPYARSLHAEEVSGFFRLKEVYINQAAQTGDPSPLDHFDDDEAIPDVADRMSVPTRWMTSPDKLAEKRQARADQKQADDLVKSAPALASVATASMKEGMDNRAK